MRRCITIIIFCHLLSFSGTLSAQIKETGIPYIVNHWRNTYNASTQNWSVTQNSKGYMYFGNNDGILEFDGTGWTTYPVPNRSVVRSVMSIGDTIYAGAFEEIGYLAPNKSGKLTWNSLNHLIPEEYADFDEVWNIFRHKGAIVFQSFNYIFYLEKDSIKVMKPLSKFSIMHEAGGVFYVVDKESGLMKVEGDKLVLLSRHPVFFHNEVRCVIGFDNNKLLIGTSNDGLFLWDGTELTSWDTEINKFIIENNLFSGIKLSEDHFCFGSISNGVYVCDKEGRVLQHLNRYKGLQNNTVLSLFQDKRKNLWLGLDNGIDYIETSSPLTILNYNFNIESAYASIIHNGIIYIGTNQGLYAAELNKMRNSGIQEDKFRLIKGTEGQVWSLQLMGNSLLCGHNFGCFQISGFQARQISDIRGFWSFIELQPNTILAGTYTGLVKLNKTGNEWQFEKEMEGFKESSRSMILDKNNILWVSHGYRGLFMLQLSDDYETISSVKLFMNNAGLPEQLPYNIQRINNKVLVSTQEGIFEFNYKNQFFDRATEYESMFKDKGFIDKIYQDDIGNLWYFTSTYLGVMRLLEDGSFRDIRSPFSGINNNLLPAFQNIFISDPANVFIGSQKGLVHYNQFIVKDYNEAEDVFFKEVSFTGNTNAMSFYSTDAASRAKIDNVLKIPYTLNSVTFRFTIPAYESPEKIKFSHRLAGFDEDWSAWDGVNFKEYTNLKEGEYTFEVKAVNAFGTESKVASFAFEVEPPFSRSKTAILIYVLVLLVIIAGNIYYFRKRLLQVRQKEKQRHEKKLAQQEQKFKEKSEMTEKEIMHLKNESLQSEMKFKNKELANTTLHLIQKNKTLTSIKEDLGKLMKATNAGGNDKMVVSNLIKKINKDLRNEKNWELFNSYFDEVHLDFIQRVKEKHPDLTPKELRLCAYLRMNISTKEIAPLMNISVRGVEISRYRLRKKLNIEHNANLTDYIMAF